MSRTYATGSTVFNVGSSQPYGSIQAAYNALAAYDGMGYIAVIQVDFGFTDTTGLNATTPLVGWSGVQIIGNPAAPDNCLIDTVGAHCFSLLTPTAWFIDGFKMEASDSEACAVNASGGGVQVSLGAVDFGSVAFACVQAYNCAQVVHTAPWSWSGACVTVHHVFGYASIGADGQNVNVNLGAAYTSYFCGSAAGFASYTGTTFTGAGLSAVSGTPVYCHGNGYIKLAGTVLPGGLPNICSGGNIDDFIGSLGFIAQGNIYVTPSSGAGAGVPGSVLIRNDGAGNMDLQTAGASSIIVMNNAGYKVLL